ncbi:replicative DNA helicase [Serpentinicella alkaliphila]|uniref:Replicative DNA helicase n=1 Tax=Serpentinicella alkaliphila TaxID=1734049 RepID=A0A4R2TIY6_9FIRM|nr:replicative DNA helicase [Serpentinicella alkaliphila]QUH25171.1 replicative DNA helicase [Serpentinicella alkaliphila]TCQ02262.1 primary replicative DNA helicase [Serpentinicella alkaliphila]
MNIENMLYKVPPHSVEAEQSVLGSMLLDKEAILTVLEVLDPEDFYKEAHMEIYESIITIFNKNEPVDIVTLTDELKKRGTLDAIGGIPYLTSLASSVPITANVKYYAEIVEEKSTLRRLIKASEEIIQLGYNSELEIAEVIETAQKNIYDISQNRQQEGFTEIKELLSNTFDRIEELYENKKGITGLTTGFIDLDRKLGGLHGSDLVLVAARPAMGKSAFALNLAHNAALKANASVAVFSLEMSKEQLVLRILAAESMIDLNKLQNGHLNEEEWTKLARSIAMLSKSNIYFDDSAGISVTEMRSKCRRLKMEKGLDLILIDYLQLMQGERRSENRQQEISSISRNLKIMAKELDCPVIALSQLSRAPDARADHRPILSDLRESGAIEQDADLVMFLYRDEYYNQESEKKNIAEVLISKHRHGETGTVELVWLGNFQKFMDYDKNRT